MEARRLIRAGRAASLATGQDGQPFASLVTPASASDLSPLMLLSSLSEHTRHLQDDPRCALLITGMPTSPNPQTAPRITVTGIAELVPAEQVAALKARWLAVHPYAALYADFGDFALWRVTIGGALLVGGFARAAQGQRACAGCSSGGRRGSGRGRNHRPCEPGPPGCRGRHRDRAIGRHRRPLAAGHGGPRWLRYLGWRGIPPAFLPRACRRCGCRAFGADQGSAGRAGGPRRASPTRPLNLPQFCRDHP